MELPFLMLSMIQASCSLFLALLPYPSRGYVKNLGGSLRFCSLVSVMPRTRAAFQCIQRSAIRAQRFAGFLDRQEHARMRVPQHLRRCRTVQRQICCGDLDVTLPVDGLAFFHG